MSRRPPPVPAPLVDLARSQAGLVSTSQCVSAGMTRQQVVERAGRKEWERVTRGVYDTGVHDPEMNLWDRRRRRGALIGPLAFPGSIVTGTPALVLQGIEGTPQEISPEVTIADGSSRVGQGPVVVRRVPLTRFDVVDGVRVATVEDALAQAVPRLGERHALAVMDSALHHGLVDVAGLARAHAAAAGHRGVARTHEWWGLADGRAESPAETWARRACLRLGIPPDVLQLEVVSANGDVVARVDLAWLLPDGGVLLAEIDGRDEHSTPAALLWDRTRQNLLASRRTIIRRYTGREAWTGALATPIQRVLRSTGWRPRPVPDRVVLRLEDL
ncbi:type IV toxin-antitoxin system AbiEi family antitoxin domain-containing protein [Xylanimonas cellulosilytica]|nr:type IV toxin-antitoxin system AbiEi family antitoxin domain-containing protein [Xylanimonas cellulosilytica]